MADAETKGRVTKAVLLVLGERFSGQILRLISNLILTRLLAPEVFGVMALSNTLVIGAQMFTDAGLHVKLVQSDHVHDTRFVNTVWTIAVLRGVAVTGVLLLATLGLYLGVSAGGITGDSVYADPILPLVLAALSLLPAIDSLQSTRVPLAQRNLAFKQLVQIQLLSQVLGIVVMVVVAWWMSSIWALVVGGFVGSLSRVIMSHTMIAGESNHFALDAKYAAEVFSFSRWIFLSSSVTFLANNADRLVLGAWIPPALMGQYSIAIFLIEAVRQVITGLANKVVLPVFSEMVRKDIDQLPVTFYKARRWFDVITALGAGGLLASGYVLIDILYDDRYQNAGVYLQLLGASLIMVRYQLTGQVMLAMNKARVMAIAPAVRAVALLVGVPVAASVFGTEAAVIAVALAYFAELPAYLWLLHRQNILSWRFELLYLPLIPVGYGVGLGFNEVVALVSDWVG